MLYGQKNFVEDGVEYPMKAGDILALSSKKKHRARAVTECAHLSIGLRPDTPTSKDPRYLTIDGLSVI